MYTWRKSEFDACRLYVNPMSVWIWATS